jgi:hypothetical protein
MFPDIRPSDPNQAVKVFNVADDGLCQHNPSPVSNVVRLGQEAMARKRRNWDDWLLIAEALQAGRTEVVHALHTNEMHGRRFEKAMGEWLIAHGFKEIDKGARSRLLDCLKHKVEIQAWRAALTDSERWKFNHPDTVLRKWKKTTAIPKVNAEPEVSAMQKLKDERDPYKRAADAGGETWNDRPRDIARMVILQCKSISNYRNRIRDDHRQAAARSAFQWCRPI